MRRYRHETVFPTHIIYVARDKEKLIADIIESDYDTEEKTLRILSIDAEKQFTENLIMSFIMIP